MSRTYNFYTSGNFTPLARHDPHAQRDAERPLELAAGDEDGEKKLSEPKDNRTEAERRYDEQAERTQARLIEKMASKSHKDKVREFNEYLSKLSEHHDIPKVGPG